MKLFLRAGASVFVLLLLIAATPLSADPPPIKVGKIYVGSFGMGDNAEEIRTMLGYELGRRGFKVVDFQPQADQILTGLLSMKVGNGKTTVRVTVFLKSKDGKMLWNDDIGGTAPGKSSARLSLQQRANDIAEALKKRTSASSPKRKA